MTLIGAGGCTNAVDGGRADDISQAQSALTSTVFPTEMEMEHHAWHGAHSPAQNSDVDRGVDFLAFHNAYIKMGRAWFATQPGVTPEMTASWTSVPPELKTTALGWNSSLAETEQRIATNNPPFAGEDDLGNYINSGIHGWLHFASSTAYSEPVLANFSSPQSTYFYKIHGLIDHWWDGWRAQAYDPTSGGPSAVVDGTRLTVFARGATNELTRTYNDQVWQPWQTLDESMASGPSAVMQGSTLVIFARGPKNVLVHKHNASGAFTGWIPLDGTAPAFGQVTAHVTDTDKGIMTSAPSAVIAGSRLVVFARGPNNTLIHRWYENGWTGWIPVGDGVGAIASSPSAVVAQTRLVVFARAVDGGLTHKFYDPAWQGWTAWIPLGGEGITSAPSAVVAGNRLVVFARKSDNTLTHRFYDWALDGWTDWIPLGGAPITSAPSAVVANGRLVVFARDTSNRLTHRYYDNGWTDWIPLGGSL
jgi:hypothetical protein